MPFDTCICCENRYGLDGADLVMIGRGGGPPVETRAELDFEKAVNLINKLMRQFAIVKIDLEKGLQS